MISLIYYSFESRWPISIIISLSYDRSTILIVRNTSTLKLLNKISAVEYNITYNQDSNVNTEKFMIVSRNLFLNKVK